MRYMTFSKTLQFIILLALSSNLFSLEFANIGFNNGICKITDFNSNDEINTSCYSWGLSTQLKSKKHVDIEVNVNFNEFSYSYIGDPRVGLLPPDSINYIQKVENTVSIIPISITLKPSYNFDKFLIYSNIGLSFLTIKSTLLGIETKTKTTGSNYSLGIPFYGGASYKITDKIGINFSIGTIYKFHNSSYKVDGYNPLAQKYFLFNTSLGMCYNFDR